MSAHKDFTLAPRASGSVSWVETLVISALALGLGWWFSPDDPLQVNATFPWVIVAPLLLGMRYGFVRGLASAALLVAALFAFRVQGVEAYAQVPAAFIVGVLLCAMLVGEFRDIWERRLERLELANEYRQLRLDEFTRAHHILRISHDRLEQRVAGNDQSLRSSLLGLRQLLRELPSEEAPLDALAETVLALLAQYGSLRIAGLYRVRHDRTPEPQPLATLGEMPALDADDLLVRTCLERGELVSVRQELLERGEQRAHSALQVCVPLVDTDGRILALLAVEQMPFFVFNERTFSLLAILAGHIADLLQSDRRALQLADIDAQRFSQYLKRSLLDARDHGLPACLYAFELTDARYGEEVQRLLEGSQRGLDVQLRLRNDEGRRVLLVLLPLTSAEGSQGYLQRLSLDMMFSDGGLQDVLRHAPDPNQRLTAIFATRRMPGKEAIPILKLALRDPADDVRLLAYSMLDQKESRINQRIEAALGRLAGATPARRGALHGTLARWYWELAYLGLAQGSVLEHILEQAREHTDQALRGTPSADLHLLAGRIALEQGRLEDAGRALQAAEEAGIDSAQLAPFRAEVAFFQRRYRDIPRLLAGMPDDMLQRPPFAALARYWT